MSEHGDKMIAEAESKLHAYEEKVLDLKKFINQIREFEGLSPLYKDLDNKPEISIGAIRSDQFYGQPLATVVRHILEMRKRANLGAATVREIYEKMIEGGYGFDATQDPQNAQRSLRISLTKNPAFHKLPTGTYGLTDWYPSAKATKATRRLANGADDESDGDEAESSIPEVIEKTVEARHGVDTSDL